MPCVWQNNVLPKLGKRYDTSSSNADANIAVRVADQGGTLRRPVHSRVIMIGLLRVFHADIIVEVSRWVSDIPDHLLLTAAASLADHPYDLIRGQGWLLRLLATFSSCRITLFAYTDKGRQKKGEAGKGRRGDEDFRVRELRVEQPSFRLKG